MKKSIGQEICQGLMKILGKQFYSSRWWLDNNIFRCHIFHDKPHFEVGTISISSDTIYWSVCDTECSIYTSWELANPECDFEIITKEIKDYVAWKLRFGD